MSGLTNESSPEMGSGHFADGDFKHACYLRQISYLNGDGALQPPDNTKSIVDNHCYNLEYYGYKDSCYGHTLQLGGPGGNCTN